MKVDAATDGLRRLEADGLVSVQRAKGKRPVVHIIHPKVWRCGTNNLKDSFIGSWV